MRVDADTALSKFTFDPSTKLPRFVLRNVSGETPTLNEDLSNSVTVRQVPLIEILSPSAASSRMVSHSEMVSEVPPPPEVVESREVRFVTASPGRPSAAGTQIHHVKFASQKASKG